MRKSDVSDVSDASDASDAFSISFPICARLRKQLKNVSDASEASGHNPLVASTQKNGTG
jgi:hypothetical protein